MAFATDPATRAYYELRAAEYDDWWNGTGRFAARERPGWDAEVQEVVALLQGLAPARTLDVACGTGFLTRHLPGEVVALDQSAAMVDITSSRVPRADVRVGDALALPFSDRAFERLFTAHFYGHLDAAERAAFLPEAARVAGELIVVDSAWRPGVDPAGWQERILDDGSRHRVFKRFLRPEELAAELDGEVLFTGTWFVAARAVAVPSAP